MNLTIFVSYQITPDTHGIMRRITERERERECFYLLRQCVGFEREGGMMRDRRIV